MSESPVYNSSSKELTSEELQHLLTGCPSIKSELNLISTGLRRRQISGSHQCAKVTIEILRNMVGKYNFNHAEHMMKVIKAVGRELIAAAQSEFAIGNLVRRVLYLIREEHAAQVKEFGNVPPPPSQTSKRDRSGSSLSQQDSAAAAAVMEKLALSPNAEKSKKSLAYVNPLDINNGLMNGSEDYTRYFPGLKAAVIGAIHELNNEIDNVAVICQRAQEQIHADECILTFGYSKIVEQFLRAAAAKRKFQLIIAEADPGLEGHKLAQNLSKPSATGVNVSQQISLTLIPDSNIYALMSRVNKVIISPNAIMADGGAICNSGILMVCLAAKEHSIPVVCVSGAFTLTPLFAHNQRAVLNQLLSPAATLKYNAPGVNMRNVEVHNPAFDYVPHDLISLYVTNDGNQLPSYVFRQLSEYYHPSDYYVL